MKSTANGRAIWQSPLGSRFCTRADLISAVAGLSALIFSTLELPVLDWVSMAQFGAESRSGNSESDRVEKTDAAETLIAGYVGNPIYYRSNVNVVRPDGTDLKLYGLGWDGDALHFPIDGGARYVRWQHGSFGYMIDFLHNKAIARLGTSSHGRKLKYPVVEEVLASGTFKGKPVAERIRLTDIFERLEFTHGHNLLYFTGLFRLPDLRPGLRPYIGLGAGFAIPHTEVWFKGEGKPGGTYEYQYAGPTVQALAGIEIQFGRMSYFIEYKFSYAWIHGLLTGDKSWKNWNLPGDLLRQFNNWLKGAEPKNGRFSTTLGAHQIIAGAGYRPTGRAPR